jgi:two-component system phosphate regulon sensor histidine kinase PhoR
MPSTEALAAHLAELEAQNARLQEELAIVKHQAKQITKTEALREFIGDMSHDLRTPLTVMKNSLYLLRQPLPPEKQARHLDILEKQVEHLHDLVNDMVTMSRLDAEMTTFHVKRMPLNEVVEECLEIVYPLLQEKDIALEVILSPDMPLVMLDRNKVARAIMNVLENALTYTPAGGHIRVETNREDEYILLDIADSGIGIEESDLPYIFDRFYRADRARSSYTGGAGLGLTIAKRIMERHHGGINVVSRAGQGSTFTLIFKILRRTSSNTIPSVEDSA